MRYHAEKLCLDSFDVANLGHIAVLCPVELFPIEFEPHVQPFACHVVASSSCVVWPNFKCSGPIRKFVFFPKCICLVVNERQIKHRFAAYWHFEQFLFVVLTTTSETDFVIVFVVAVAC